MQKTLKCNRQSEEMYRIQTDQMAIEIHFMSPIKEICQFLQKIQKYSLKASLLSSNLKINEFDNFYQTLRGKVAHKYKIYLSKAMQTIQQLFVSIQFLKIAELRHYKELVDIFRRNLLHKDIDTYAFDVHQFDNRIEKVRKYLATYPHIIDPEESQRVKQQIQTYILEIDEVEKIKMEDMQNCKVKNPYYAQNLENKGVESGSLFEKYYQQVNRVSDKWRQSLEKKYFNICQSLENFNCFNIQSCLKTQGKAYQLIRQYERLLPNNSHYETDLFIKDYKDYSHLVDPNEFILSHIHNFKMSALVNRKLKVKFKQFVNIYDPMSKQEQLIKNNQLKQHEVVNKNKLIDTEYVFGQKLSYAQKIVDSENIFIYLLKKLWKSEQRWQQCLKNLSEVRKYNLYSYINLQNVNEESNPRIHEEQVELRRKINAKYEEKQRQEDKRRKNMLKNLLKIRTYQSFSHLYKKIDITTYKTHTFIYRYGININFQNLTSNNTQSLERFFLLYFKERYYREHSNIHQNDQNPIMFDQQASEKKVISYLVKLTKKHNFYLIWGKDIIYFLAKDSLKRSKNCIYFICYTLVKNSQRVVYEVRRKMQEKVEEMIVCKYLNDERTDGLQVLYSKIQNVHRVIENRHHETMNCRESVQKGKQIAKEIIETLLQQVPFRQD